MKSFWRYKRYKLYFFYILFFFLSFKVLSEEQSELNIEQSVSFLLSKFISGDKETAWEGMALLKKYNPSNSKVYYAIGLMHQYESIDSAGTVVDERRLELAADNFSVAAEMEDGNSKNKYLLDYGGALVSLQEYKKAIEVMSPVIEKAKDKESWVIYSENLLILLKYFDALGEVDISRALKEMKWWQPYVGNNSSFWGGYFLLYMKVDLEAAEESIQLHLSSKKWSDVVAVSQCDGYYEIQLFSKALKCFILLSEDSKVSPRVKKYVRGKISLLKAK